MKHVVALLLWISAVSISSAEFDPFAGPKPMLVFIHSDPWAMVLGADTPRVAVYEEGTVIYFKESEDSFHHKKLSTTELADIKKHLTPIFALKELTNFYNLRPNTTDQPEAFFYVRDGEREVATRVYGLRDGGAKRAPYTVRPGRREPDKLPAELSVLHEFLCAIDYAESKKWTPQYVEVMIWPYEYAPDASIVWPKDWPGLESDRTLKRGDSYSIFLDGSLMPEVQKFLRSRKERGPVEIGGKKWAASFRAVFPSEPVWRKAFARKKNEK